MVFTAAREKSVLVDPVLWPFHDKRSGETESGDSCA